MWNEERIRELLKAYEDAKYRDFHGALTHTRYERVGVRVPVLRTLAKEIIRSGEWREFLAVRPIILYEHAMLAGIISASVKEPYSDKMERLRAFAAYIDDWAVCDITCSSLKCKDERFFKDMCAFAKSPDVWTARIGLVVILGNFADREHIDGIRETINAVKAQDYYIDMAVGWLICTAESHDEGAGIELMKTAMVSDEVLRIAAYKMRDSFRVSQKSKEEAARLAKVKRKNNV